MTLKAMYDTFASHYSTADCFGSITDSHTCALSQITNANLGLRPHYKVLDFGVGDGAFLKKLSLFMPEAEFTGIDVSGEMLKYAKDTISLTTIEASAIDASQYLPLHSQDLVLA